MANKPTADAEEQPLAEPAIPQRRSFRSQLVTSLIVSWLAIIQGYASAYTAPADISMQRDLQLTQDQSSWITSLLPIGALIGCLSGAVFLEKLGRKRTLLYTDIVFLFAWLVNFNASHYSVMYFSRILVGLGVGVTSLTLPIYLTETISPKFRGRLGLLPTGFGNFGILLCYCLGNFFEWKTLAAIGLFLPMPFLIAIWYIPETPYFYIMKKNNEKAKKSLLWLRGGGDIQKELEYICRTSLPKNRLKVFWTKPHPRATLIVLGLMFFQQFSGINAIIFYTTQIFEEIGSSLDPSLCTTIIGIVNFMSSLLATILIDKIGRKRLLYLSAILMAISLLALGCYFYLFKVLCLNLTDFGWIPLTMFILYILAFSFGFGPVPWLMMGEILPAVIRGPAASLCSAFNWLCTFVITKTFPLIEDSIGTHYSFGIFFVLMCASVCFIKFWVPETKKKTLEEIEAILCNNINEVSTAAV